MDKSNLSIESLEFMNAFGIVFSDRVLIHKYNPRKAIKYEDLKIVSIRKKRSFYWNYIIGIIAVVLFLSYLIFEELTGRVTLLYCSLLLLIPSVLYKNFIYSFILIDRHNEKKVFLIEKYLKDDAKKILTLIKSKIPKR